MTKPKIVARPARADEVIWCVIAHRGSYQTALSTPRGARMMTMDDAQNVINADARDNPDNEYTIMRAHTVIERTVCMRVRKV